MLVQTGSLVGGNCDRRGLFYEGYLVRHFRHMLVLLLETFGGPTLETNDAWIAFAEISLRGRACDRDPATRTLKTPFGSFSTEPGGPACQLMSAFTRNNLIIARTRNDAKGQNPKSAPMQRAVDAAVCLDLSLRSTPATSQAHPVKSSVTLLMDRYHQVAAGRGATFLSLGRARVVNCKLRYGRLRQMQCTDRPPCNGPVHLS